ncbi:hypothetical protein ACUND2_22515 [Serratia sp. IR-2025]
MIQVNIVLQQCQKAYEAEMDELCLFMFKRAIGHLVLNKSQDEALAIAANFLTLDCIEFLEQYAEDVENNPVDHAAYHTVISSIFLL